MQAPSRPGLARLFREAEAVLDLARFPWSAPDLARQPRGEGDPVLVFPGFGAGDASTVRSVFIIDPEHRVRLTLTYPKSVGRNFDELVRVIDALQATDAAPIATPADWRPGDRVIVSPTVSTDDARERLENVEEVKPYLRWADQP